MINLEDAKLCTTDDVIHSDERCPSCGSKCFIQLVGILQMCSLKLEKARIKPSGVFDIKKERVI